MTNNDYNAIKPIESLQNIANITPANDRQKKKKQQNPQDKDGWQDEYFKDQINLSNQEDMNIQTEEIDPDKHSIDYRA